MNKNVFQDKLQESLRIFNNRIAVRCGSQTMTYNDIDRKSNYIANWLLEKKIMRETLIGILMNDRVRFIYTMIGILKAGCVFVSLDPAYPDNKLDSMIKFTGTSMVLADELNHERGRQQKFICIDNTFLEEDCQRHNHPVELTFSGEDPIYIYFTSGSSGFPKAILGKNKSLLHFIDWEIKTFSIDESFKVSQFTTTGFDASLRDIFVPLFSGGCIYIPEDPDILLNSERLIQWIDSAGLNLIHCVPSLFKMLVNKDITLLPTHFQELKYILLSGERISPRDLVRWYEIFAERIQLVNFWGPTETTMIKTFYFINKVDVEKEHIPIGKPMAGARVIIMDETMKVCKERIPGKLYIRTPYRSFGYCNDPALTQAKFIRNPFNNDPSDLLYDTGDQGLLLANGNIEFLGRQDRQVKIMGIRIELDGIENILLKHPAVDEAAAIKQTVASQTSKPDEELLCVYITRKKNDTTRETTAADIRSYLLNELPGYMVPPMVLEIEKIPRKPNGKIDYDSLPDPFKEKEKEYVPPITELQVKLAGLWSEILKINKISIKSHFFELGGNSLNLMALLSKIHREFDVHISLEKMFNNPTIEKLATVIMELEREQYFAIQPVEKKEYYVVSPAQERLYFLYQLEKDSTAYNMPLTVSLKGELDKEKLKKTVGKIIKRHESFRTTFEMIDGKPVQKIHEDEKLQLEISSFVCNEETVDNKVNEFFKPFDLGCAPLLRIGLIKTNDCNHVLILDTHHIVSDGTSLTLLIDEIIKLYEGVELPLLNIQYKDFADWWTKENKWLKKQEEYWLQEYAQSVPVLNLPLDFSRPIVQSSAGEAFTFEIENEQIEKLKTLSASRSVTLFMAFTAIFNILLTKISSQEDIIVGTGVEGRNHDDIRHIIGMFVNTLALRYYVESEYTFFEFLEQVKYRVLNGLENQDYPFERLVEKLQVNRDTGRNPLFDVMFMLHNNIEAIELPRNSTSQLQLTPYHGKINRTSKFDLTFHAAESDIFVCEFEYSTSLFSSKTIERFADYFKKILMDILENPGKKISMVDMITAEEKQRILEDFNNTEAGYPFQKTIHGLFAEQAEQRPDNIAVSDAMQTPLQITYCGLNEQADRLARLLGEKGICPDTIVAIILERSIEIIIGIMGILKSGGTYLPIDPEYPQERIEYMLKDSGAKVLAVANELEGEKVRRWEGELLAVANGSEGEKVRRWEGEKKISSYLLNSSNIAYLIYTSGTTGRPKGSLITHYNVVRLMCNEKFQFDFSNRDIWTLYHSYCFDFSVWEMYGALLYGGKLIIVPRIVSIDNKEFFSLLAKTSVTVLNQTPSAFYNLIELNSSIPAAARCLHIRTIIFGGEALKPGKLEPWRKSYPHTKFINMFGITETTVHVTYKEITEKEINANKSNIGQPIPTLTVYILDNWLKPTPIGISGEIYVGGLGVGRGYLNRVELTKDKFIANPYKKFDRLYRSGDLGRYMENGDIEYLGRIDQQVKIRGFRIELGEIENKLLKHYDIKEAVVIEKERRLEKYLCAYIVSEKKLEASGLRTFLTGHLPDYMIPSHFEQVEKIPLTPNGKVDIKYLAQLGKKLEIGTAYVAPQNTIERQIAAVWKQVLALDKVGINDNYFELGGTSFDILKIKTLLKETFQLDIPVLIMFTYPTIHSFAEYIINNNQETTGIRDRSSELDQSIENRKEQFQRRKGIQIS